MSCSCSPQVTVQKGLSPVWPSQKEKRLDVKVNPIRKINVQSCAITAMGLAGQNNAPLQDFVEFACQICGNICRVLNFIFKPTDKLCNKA